MWISNCPQLVRLPEEGLPTSPFALEIVDCPLLKHHCHKEEGEDWPKVAHNAAINMDGEAIFDQGYLGSVDRHAFSGFYMQPGILKIKASRSDHHKPVVTFSIDFDWKSVVAVWIGPRSLTTKKSSLVGTPNWPRDAAMGNSVVSCVINKLTNDKIELCSTKMGNEGCPYKLSISLSFRMCMANVLISACQKMPNSGKKTFARKVLPHLIQSMGSAVLPYASELLKVSLKSLTDGSDKEKVAGAKLMASLMASEEALLESIAGGLLDARTILSSISSPDTSPEVQQRSTQTAKKKLEADRRKIDDEGDEEDRPEGSTKTLDATPSRFRPPRYLDLEMVEFTLDEVLVRRLVW
ncbi:hypothetical protein Vadar_011560 [Vaccinium darrowii]|uniref:Uncharacterized protein n=1 Tax=Vaccinium darrowii TaxID=229202 RepID=A0ACB7YM35_9ERIC|nr:hypothetical protein Vadar_011560 [Vaccinium darrowii]